MFIRSLFLKNFRNYDKLDIGAFSDKVNVITGKNAQGKTNIIEAFSLLACGKSFRVSRDFYMIKEGENETYLKIQYDDRGLQKNVEMLLQKGKKKGIRIGGETVKKMSELFRALNVVVFSPEDLKIVKESPQLRRQFLDEEICKIRPSYLDALKNFQKLLSEKNAALKKYGGAESLIDVYNGQMTDYIAVILKNRESYCLKLTEHINAVLSNMDVAEQITISYLPTLPKEDILGALEKIKKREIVERQCLTGPQRDEVCITSNGREAKYFASQGQTRTIMLATKIAAVNIIRDSTGRTPVLLLDDVFSELDASRKNWVLQNLKDIQTFITTADSAEAKKIDAKVFEVKAGAVSEWI